MRSKTGKNRLKGGRSVSPRSFPGEGIQEASLPPLGSKKIGRPNESDLATRQDNKGESSAWRRAENLFANPGYLKRKGVQAFREKKMSYDLHRHPKGKNTSIVQRMTL